MEERYCGKRMESSGASRTGEKKHIVSRCAPSRVFCYHVIPDNDIRTNFPEGSTLGREKHQSCHSKLTGGSSPVPRTNMLTFKYPLAPEFASSGSFRSSHFLMTVWPERKSEIKDKREIKVQSLLIRVVLPFFKKKMELHIKLETSFQINLFPHKFYTQLFCAREDQKQNLEKNIQAISSCPDLVNQHIQKCSE